MTAQITRKFDLKAQAEPNMFGGYGAVYGAVDSDGDIIVPGAFADSIKNDLPVLLWQHNTKEPIGRFVEVNDNEKGLYVKGQLSTLGKGAEAYELISMGALNGLSVGFITQEATREAKTGIRTIHKAKLMEISVVSFPANDAARIDMVKAASLTTRELEVILTRDARLSRKAAQSLMRGGINELTMRDAGDDTDKLVKRLDQFNSNIKNWSA
jgi:HK97 family phage prohead protease